uniref:Myb-like protein Z isoform X1 n=1 Tax=Diabrotica virgifera virgifera TaxID=50390 RepID=A0A6P7H8K4_DIAVI
MVIHSTDDVKIRFGGDVRRLHPVPFINSLKTKVQHIGNFETAKQMIRNHLKYEAGLWFDSKEEEIDSWQQFEQKFLNYLWGKVQQMEINKELQNEKYNDRMGISEKTYALQVYTNAKYLQYNYSSEQLVELIARHFEETLEDHITLQNYKDIDSLCQFLQIRESRQRERKSRRSQEDYRSRETQDYRDRRQNNRRDYTRRDFNPRRENENRDNGRENYEQRNRQWNEDRNRENQNRNTTHTNQENRNNGRQDEHGYRQTRNRSDRPRANRREVNNTQTEEYDEERHYDENINNEEEPASFHEGAH